MAPRAPVGMTIKRARERMRMTQAELGAAVGVSQKTIDNWEHDRSYPKSSIGAIEEVLHVNLDGHQGVEPYVTQDEATIWSLASFTEDERRALILALRRERSGDG